MRTLIHKLAFEGLEQRALLAADAAMQAADAAAMTAPPSTAATTPNMQSSASSSLTTGGAVSPDTGNVNNGVGTNGQFGLQQGINITPNGDVAGNLANTSFGSQNPGDAGAGAPGTSFNPGIGLATRPGDQNPGDAGFGAPGTSFNPTGVPTSQAGPGGNGTAASTQATEAAFGGTDTAAFDPAIVQFEIENATLHPIR